MELFDFIQEYWQILIGLGTILVLAAKLEMTTRDQEKRICVLEKEIHEMNPIFLDIRERLISIETTLNSRIT